MMLPAIYIARGKHAGRTGHVLRRFRHTGSGVQYVDVQVQGDPRRDSMPRDIADYTKLQGLVTRNGYRRVLPQWAFVVTVREERTELMVQP